MISYSIYSHVMSNHIPDPELERHLARTAVKASLAWSGWGSPVGLSVALVSTGLFLVCLHLANLIH